MNQNSLNIQKVSALSLSVVVVLYLAHALPLYFYNVALPAILRHQGVDLRWIGMLSLLYIPWAFKFFWAPLIDRFYLKKLGKRKTWLLFTQIALVLGVVALALTQFDYGLGVFVIVGLWISTFAATQDIAIDGYTVETFSESEYRLGSMAQSIGVALGSMVGGAATLWLYQLYGWQTALISLAAMTALTMLAIFQIKEKSSTEKISKQPPSLIRAFKRPEMLWALALIVCYRFVEAPAMAMLNPMLIDQKWSLAEIGVLMSVIGAGIGLLAAVSAAFLLKKIAATQLLIWAGWARTLIYALLGAAVLLSWFDQWQRLLGVFVVVILAIRYIAMTALYAHFMQTSSKDQAGTDFTILVCFELLVYFIGGAMSGFLAKAFGYGNFYLILAAASILSVLLSQVLISKAKQSKQLI
ncbi:putative ferric acinetoferrin MFS transporter permease subunit ActC [Acinetobacter haemolyticus]|uniref:putative ferric acinetoferrin MFS transporter permease subunit ActC n=1 Tax=Acinetobacter haemolyticus TaxID=29430 RepID=UPI001331D695|nr:putative ferric acinetoferrin MFS transporter permease subunit ActC [Acinetobacter haemolyticus]NAR59155.1 putative ferric acinetoferrin MFS transporter permease subunit ActC [Acinetobacter haemolyticus]NAR65759.1 putative ferric acinetoferrin MFS transporter permease subunit ActC [Acinetobacter haemolyticus]NAR70302.1 putative ferric acinetoferrin MFS transporter permease subunit ActC [Acinetobacter haemolyticus]NAR81733.1 putative ferric acinetoferrin MFS transporter permease subunit ActC 